MRSRGICSVAAMLVWATVTQAGTRELAGFDPVLSAPSALAEARTKSLPLAAPVATTPASTTFSFRARWRPSAELLPGYVGSVSLSPALLQAPASDNVDLSKPVIGTRPPRQLSTLSVEIEGITYALAVQQEAADVSYGLRQVTLSVLGQPQAYARFSVDDASGWVMGTLYVGGITYRVVPSADAPEQHIYRVEATMALMPLTSRASTSPRIAQMEERQLQLEQVARLRVVRSLIAPQVRALHLQGGQLGSMQPSAAGFRAVVHQLQRLTRADGDESFELARVVPLNQGQTRLRFVQTLKGVPVQALNEAIVDEQGRILEITTQLAREPQNVRARFTAKDAVDFVKQHWPRAEGQALDSITVLETPTLWYVPNPTLDNLKLVYELRFKVNTQTDEYRALVDADSAKVSIMNLTKELGSRVCTSVAGGIRPQNCAPGYTIQYATPPAPAFTCTSAVKNVGCNSDTRRVSERMTDIAAKAAAAGQTNPQYGCCTQVAAPRGYLDVHVGSGEVAANNASFSGDGTIRLGSSVAYMPETLAHEFMHAYIHYYNDVLAVSQSRFSRAFQEGISDAFAAVYGAVSGDPSAFGQKWVYGDGPDFRGGNQIIRRIVRDGRTNLTWRSIDDASNFHDAGTAFLQFFRRLQEQSGVSDQRLLGILMGTAAGLRDLDGNGLLDSSDFARAVLATLHSTETSLIQATTRIYGEMMDEKGSLPAPAPVGLPGPVGAPATVASVWGALANCGRDPETNARVTVYTMNWSVSVGASMYGMYVKLDTESQYRFSDATSGTSGYVWTNAAGDSRISACNGNGCSGLSPDAMRAVHIAQCGW